MFDDFGQLRILAPSDYEDSDKIRDLTLEFNSSFNTFNTQIKSLLDSLSNKSLVIQNAQLEALGYLIQLDSLQDKRIKADAQDSAILKEKKAESARYLLFFKRHRLEREIESLTRVLLEKQEFLKNI